MAAQLKVTNTRTISGSSITVADLRVLIEGMPDSATVEVSHYSGDFREPASVDTITVRQQ